MYHANLVVRICFLGRKLRYAGCICEKTGFLWSPQKAEITISRINYARMEQPVAQNVHPLLLLSKCIVVAQQPPVHSRLNVGVHESARRRYKNNQNTSCTLLSRTFSASFSHLDVMYWALPVATKCNTTFRYVAEVVLSETCCPSLRSEALFRKVCSCLIQA